MHPPHSSQHHSSWITWTNTSKRLFHVLLSLLSLTAMHCQEFIVGESGRCLEEYQLWVGDQYVICWIYFYLQKLKVNLCLSLGHIEKKITNQPIQHCWGLFLNLIKLYCCFPPPVSSNIFPIILSIEITPFFCRKPFWYVLKCKKMKAFFSSCNFQCFSFVTFRPLRFTAVTEN